MAVVLEVAYWVRVVLFFYLSLRYTNTRLDMAITISFDVSFLL
jgi:hypothetical protein